MEEEQGVEIKSVALAKVLLGDIDEIFEFWKVRLGHVRARLDQKRRSKIRQRLCDGYKKQDILDAIEGCALSPWHMGRDPRNSNATVFDDIELICRDAKHVDQFIKLFEKERSDKARAKAAAKALREEEERRDRERRERAGQPRISGLRSV